MLAIVSLRDTRTNKTTIYHDRTAYPSVDAAIAHWTEGECSCDCNRGLAIWKATHATSSMPSDRLLPCRRVQHVIKLVEIEVLVVIEEVSPQAARAIVVPQQYLG